MKLLLVAALSLASCLPPGPPNPPGPIDLDCATPASHIEAIGCGFADRFQRVCVENALKGLSMDTSCVLSSKKCSEVLKCR